MADDISKVDIPRYVLRIEGGATGWGCYPHKADDGDWCKHSEVLRSKFYADLVSNRLESATTPAEVGEDLDSECQMHREMHFRIDNIVMGTGAFEVTHDGGQREAWENTVAAIATLARQLAEAKAAAERHERNDILQMQRAIKAESQLAEATRRLGEVQVALKLWRDGEESGDYLTQVAARDARDALLTKEPTK